MESSAAPTRSREHWILLATAFVLLLGLVLIGLVFTPDARGYGTHEQLGLKPCLPLVAWNVPCPGCGITTSVTHATHGQVLASLRAQPFGLLIVLATLAFLPWALAVHFSGRDILLELSLKPWVRIVQVVLSLFVLAWLYKIAVVRGWV